MANRCWINAIWDYAEETVSELNAAGMAGQAVDTHYIFQKQGNICGNCFQA